MCSLELVWEEITAFTCFMSVLSEAAVPLFLQNSRLFGFFFNSTEQYLNFCIAAPLLFLLLQCHFGPEDDGGE